LVLATALSFPRPSQHLRIPFLAILQPLHISTDWPESSTTLAALTGAAGGQAKDADPSQQLWEDNWDDDDVEVAFTAQLR
jgi:hypothetical protein